MNRIIPIIIFIILLISGGISTIQGFSIEKINDRPKTNQFLNNDEPYEGYTLFAPEWFTYTYLINNDGVIIHTWKSIYTNCLGTYLLENGNLVRTSLVTISSFITGGYQGRVEILDLNGTNIWTFEYSTEEYCSHHDIEVLPNGNILIIAWEKISELDFIVEGKNPELISGNEIWSDYIIEVEPTGQYEGNIVWEWHAWDHLIQDYDMSKNNYGIVANHPELIDINFGSSLSDWIHTNSIDYNIEYDQILLSAHNFDEVWVIDHSTTTEEARGHTGGNSGKGGDLLYRWGNPRAYDNGNFENQVFFGQHDAQWIEPGCPGEGNILVFNNGLGRPGRHSSVDEFRPPVSVSGEYEYVQNSAYEPKQLDWRYTAEIPSTFYSGRLSGAQRLPNGNTLICIGQSGIFLEVTYEKVTVWEYENLFSKVSKNVFKIHRYSPNYPGLANIIDKHAPLKPSKPNGPNTGNSGTEYTYSSSTIDPDNDNISYFFDWSDGTDSGWLGPYESGESVTTTHIWSEQGDYIIRVIAKDVNGTLSSWSDPLSVSMPKNKFCCLIEKLPFLKSLIENFILFNNY